MKTTIKYLYISILLASPLALGTTETWARLLISFGIFLCAMLFFRELWGRRVRLLKVPGLLPLLAFCGVMMFQIMPLPALGVKLLSPATYTLYQDTAGLLGPVRWMRLTVDFKATVLQLIQFSAYVLFYLLTVQLLSQAEFLRRVVVILVWYGLILAFLSVLNHFSMPETAFWLRESPQRLSFGPYAHRNHYAGMMVMLFPVTFFMMLHFRPQISSKNFGERTREFFNHLSSNFYLILMLTAIVMAASLFAAASRGGVLCLSLSLLFIGILMTHGKNTRRPGKMSVAMAVGATLFLMGGFGWKPVFARFDKLHEDGVRLENKQHSARLDAVEVIKSYPIFGTGAGTFSHARKAFSKASSENGLAGHAGNDYMEIAAEQGVLGIGGFAAFIATLLTSIKQFRRRKHPYYIHLFCGALTGLTAILIFGLFESQLSNGANAVYFFFLSGLCVAAAHTRKPSVRHPTFLETNRKAWLEKGIGSVAVFLFFWGTALFGGACLGELKMNNLPALITEPPSDTDLKIVAERASKATVYDPLDSRNLVVLAKAQSVLTTENKSVSSLLNRAIRLNPVNSDNLQATANYFSSRGQLTLSQKFYRAALKYDPANALIRGEYGCWLMAQGFLKKGAEEMQSALALSPGLTQKFVGRMTRLNLSYEETASALPARVGPFLELGEYLMQADQKKSALRAYRRAAKNIAEEKVIRASWIERICAFYLEQEMLDDAFQAASTGVKYLPKDSNLRYTLGTVYEKMGVPYRAAEEYELAVVLNPRNISAVRRLERIQGP